MLTRKMEFHCLNVIIAKPRLHQLRIIAPVAREKKIKLSLLTRPQKKCLELGAFLRVGLYLKANLQNPRLAIEIFYCDTLNYEMLSREKDPKLAFQRAFRNSKCSTINKTNGGLASPPFK